MTDVLLEVTHESRRSDPDPLRAELLDRKGDQQWRDFSAEVGLHVSMLRAYLRGDSDAGIDTLCVLAAWDPSLRPLIVSKMVERGERYRARLQTREQKAA
jgi:hypothetical protein